MFLWSQGQLSTCLRCWWVGGISLPSMLLHDRWVIGKTLLCSQCHGWFAQTSSNGICFVVLSKRGAESVLPSVPVGGGQGQLSCVSDIRASFPTEFGLDGQGKGISPWNMPPHDRWIMEKLFLCSKLWACLTSTPVNRIGSIALPRWGTGNCSPKCWTCGGQSQHYHLTQVLMGASFSTHADTWQISNRIAVPCLQFWDQVTHTTDKRIHSFVLPRWGVKSALSIVEADDRQGQLSRSFVLRARSPNCFEHWCAEVGIVGPLPLPVLCSGLFYGTIFLRFQLELQ